VLIYNNILATNHQDAIFPITCYPENKHKTKFRSNVRKVHNDNVLKIKTHYHA